MVGKRQSYSKREARRKLCGWDRQPAREWLSGWEGKRAMQRGEKLCEAGQPATRRLRRAVPTACKQRLSVLNDGGRHPAHTRRRGRYAAPLVVWQRIAMTNQ
jgi:hypothetical protein